MIATARSCEYGNESLGLITKGYIWLCDKISNADGRSYVKKCLLE